MRRWLFPSRKKCPIAKQFGSRIVKLEMEGLESRICPAAPSITSFSAMVMSGQTVMLMGMVSDPNPGPVTVQFSGVASGSTTTSNGSFSLQTQANMLGMICATPFDSLGAGPASQTQLSTPPPCLALNMSQNPGGSCILSGSVQSRSAGGLTIMVSGAVVGSVSTASDGSYSLTAQATGPGTVTVYTKDIWGQQSNVDQVVVSNNGPTITMSVAQQADRSVLVSGQVQQVSAPVTVTLSGVVSGTVTTTATGVFSFTGTANALGSINAWASVAGQNSYGSCQLTNNPPSITNFQVAVSGVNTYTFTGDVSDEWAPGLTVTLYGIPDEGNETAPVADDDTFTLVVQLPADANGTVYANVTDWWGAVSPTVSAVIN